MLPGRGAATRAHVFPGSNILSGTIRYSTNNGYRNVERMNSWKGQWRIPLGHLTKVFIEFLSDS